MLEYSQEDIKSLFDPLERDFYGRMDFGGIQAIILADRTIRLNYLVSRILEIPVEKVHKKSHYTLKIVGNRKLPLNVLRKRGGAPVKNKENELYGWLYRKKKLNDIEHFMRKERYNHKYAHLFHREHVQPEFRRGQNFQNSLGILRN